MKAQKKEELETTSMCSGLYDMNAVQTYEFEIDGETVAIKIKPLTDEYYKELFAGIDLSSDNKETQRKIYEAQLKQFNELVIDAEKYDFDIEDIIQIMARYELARVRDVIKATEGFAVVTECYFDGKPTSQTHLLRKKTIDDSIEYSGIAARQYKAKPGKSLDSETNYTYVPQHQAKADLYDSMMRSADGYEDHKVPIRVKALVIDNIFGSKLSPKK
jgi:hypothetical protein